MPLSKSVLEPFSSDLLVKVATPASTEILTCALKKKLPSRLGGRIATALDLIALHLEEMQPFQLPATAQELSQRALQDLLKFCNWPSKPDAKKVGPSSVLIYNELNVMFSLHPENMRAGIERFLATKQTDLEFYANRFVELLDLLDPANRKLDGAGQSSLHGNHLKPHDEYVYQDDIRENLVTALKKQATCIPFAHESETLTNMPSRHLTRLCLSTEGRYVKHHVEFDLVIASLNFDFWQDFSLRVASLKIPSSAAEPPDDTDRQLIIMKAGDVCRILERGSKSLSGLKLLLELDHDCRLHKHQLPRTLPYPKARGKGLSLAELLDSGEYSLTPRNKIMLAFAVARGFWEFYGSELTMARWSSEDIWFMPRWKTQASSDKLELKAFVSSPFGQGPPGPGEFLEADDLTHSYPQILSLGIILLEIGRGKKLGFSPLVVNKQLGDLRDSVNDAHSDASSQLAALSNEVWEACTYKIAFDTAISNCLDPMKFIETHSTRKRRSRLSPQEYEKLSPEKKAAEDQERIAYQKRAVQERRDAIYEKVVSPLCWLARAGNVGGEDDMFIKSHKHQHAKVRRRYSYSEDPEEAEIKELWKRVQSPNFDCDRRVERSAERWFENIRDISTVVFRKRRLLIRKGIKLAPVRIAILDTGCDMTLNSLQEAKAKCFKGWKDFAVEPPSETEVDEYGHGTFMARLVLQMVPGCELYIARIAQTTQQLEDNEESVAKAIRYAGRQWEVDVISMSFGFPKFSQPISDAIHDVRKEREGAIVFLASAGNDVDLSEAYPACDPSVIPIYATESNGGFLKTNPIPSDESRCLLGTYGSNVPDAVLAELRALYTERDFSTGTSVATAVAAGIAGLVLEYAAFLSHVLRKIGAEGLCSELKTTDGMRHMLFGMARTRDGRQYFVNPVLFWCYTRDDLGMFRRICKALPLKEVMR